MCQKFCIFHILSISYIQSQIKEHVKFSRVNKIYQAVNIEHQHQFCECTAWLLSQISSLIVTWKSNLIKSVWSSQSLTSSDISYLIPSLGQGVKAKRLTSRVHNGDTIKIPIWTQACEFSFLIVIWKSNLIKIRHLISGF